MAEWDGNEGSCSCDCGFDIPKGGTLEGLTLNAPLGIGSGGTGANAADVARNNLGIYSGISGLKKISATSPGTVSILFGVTFAQTPNVVVSPQCSATASESYGIFCYIVSVNTTGCTVRLNTNFPDDLTVYVQWAAIGSLQD